MSLFQPLMGIISRVTAVPAAASTLYNGLVSWHRMEEAQGSDRLDSASQHPLVERVGYPCTQVAGIDAAKYGAGFPSASEVLTSDSADYALQGADFTIALDLYMTSWPSNDGIFGRNIGTGGESAYYLYTHATSGLSMVTQNNAGTYVEAQIGSLSTGQWYRVVCMWDQSAMTGTIIVDDGTPVVSPVLGGTFSADSNTKPLCVGAYQTASSVGMRGYQDNFVVWDRILTAAEVTEFQTLTDIPAAVPPTSGLLMQLDGSVSGSFWANDGKTINSSEGGVVAVWEDQSGNGNDWIQTNNSYRPLAHLSANRLYNDGTGAGSVYKHLTGPNISAWTGGSFFARVQNIAGPQGSMWGTTAWSSSSSLGHWSYSGDNGSHYVCFGATARPNAFAWSGQAESSLDLMNYEENIDTDGTMQAYINGTQRYSAYASTPAFRTVPYLGCGVRNNGPQYSTGSYFYKVCAYDRVVTAEERTQILAWLNA